MPCAQILSGARANHKPGNDRLGKFAWQQAPETTLLDSQMEKNRESLLLNLDDVLKGDGEQKIKYFNPKKNKKILSNRQTGDK